MLWIDAIGWAASAAVLATFCMSTMISLRVLALVSNVLFCAFDAIAHIYPVLILHTILLPVNTLRLVQIRRMVLGVQAAASAELSIETLFPFMSQRRFKAGEVPFRKGDKANRMFYLTKGNMEIRELGKVVGAGTPMRRREFISLIGGAATWPLAAGAQQPERMRRIDVLMAYAESDREGQTFVAAFREGLQKLGWMEGRNIRIDTRWAAGDTEAIQRLAKELRVSGTSRSRWGADR
jgi:hypothetical protein